MNARGGCGLIADTRACFSETFGDRSLGGTALISLWTTRSRAAWLRLALACASAGGLSACASGSIETSNAFADPAKYALYDCKQLEGLRTSHAARIDELRRLMAKAATGPAGGAMAELAYRPDMTRAQADLASANSSWERNRCGAAG